MRIELSKRAQSDIESHTAYLLERNPEAAASFIEALARVFRLLGQHPLAGAPILLKSRRAAVRRWLVPPMAIYYEPLGDVLYVIRVRHGARRPITE